MAKNRTSSFNDAADGLFEKKDVIKKQVQEVQETQEAPKRAYGTTQGKKGQHAKRINMAFSDDNHEYITKESRRRGISATAFVNEIIDQYRAKNV